MTSSDRSGPQSWTSNTSPMTKGIPRGVVCSAVMGRISSTSVCSVFSPQYTGTTNEILCMFVCSSIVVNP